MVKVCHVTSVHSNDDTRIFHKECCTLAESGYNVVLIAPGKNEFKNGIKIVGCGDKPTYRIMRIFSYARRVCKIAILQDADVYHLHDPELLLHAGIFLAKNKMVIFDSHEDYSVEKEYLPVILRKIVRKIYLVYEKYIFQKIGGIICCYQWTQERIKSYCDIIEMVYNYPQIEDSYHEYEELDKNKLVIGYAGGIDPRWNQESIIDALASVENTSLILAGSSSNAYINKLQQSSGWSKVSFLGKISHDVVKKQVYNKSDVGIALLGYIPVCKGHYGNLANTKLFEIMEAGLPVIGTDFVLWKEVIEGHNCGICVNPYSQEEISIAMKWMLEHSEERKQMGINARKAVETTYNWDVEAEKLLTFYDRVIDITGGSEE